MYPKTNHSRMLGTKGDMTHKLIGGVKSAARFVEDPLVQFGVSAIAPEVGAGLALAKGTGLLQKIGRR